MHILLECQLIEILRFYSVKWKVLDSEVDRTLSGLIILLRQDMKTFKIGDNPKEEYVEIKREIGLFWEVSLFDWSSLILEVDEPCGGRSIGGTEREVVGKCA